MTHNMYISQGSFGCNFIAVFTIVVCGSATAGFTTQNLWNTESVSRVSGSILLQNLTVNNIAG